MKKLPFKNRPITQQTVHVIYRLKGSLPKQAVTDIATAMETEIAQLKTNWKPIKKEDIKGPKRRAAQVAMIKTKYQLHLDRLLDQINQGPMFLQDSEAKQSIIDSWLHLEKTEQLKIYGISVMSNHVHVLLAYELEGELNFKKLLERHKRYTAKAINKQQDQKGRKVWATKAFDRDLRRNTFGTVLAYILNNPVKAGLTNSPLEWHGNYLRPELIDN